jgi:hypothetical protein
MGGEPKVSNDFKSQLWCSLPTQDGYPDLRLDAHQACLYMSGPGALLYALLLHGCACLSRQTAGGACEGNVQVWTHLKGRNVAQARLR